MKRKFAHASMSVLVPMVIFVFAVSAQYATPFGKIVQNLISDSTASTADAVFSYASDAMGPPGAQRENPLRVASRVLESVGAQTADRIIANGDEVELAGRTIESFYANLNRTLPGRHVPEQMADTVFAMSDDVGAAPRALEAAVANTNGALLESAGQMADAAMGGANAVHALYASLGRNAAGSVATTADAFAGSSAAINGTSATILDSIGSAIGSAADAVQSFFLNFLSRPPVVSTVSPSVSVAPSPTSTTTAGGTTTVTNIMTTTSVTQAQLVAALRTLLSQGLPADILAQLRGPQGPAGPAGVQGPAGFSIGAVYSNPSNPNQAGTFGGVTYFGTKELTTEKLTATGTSTLATLNVTGATTLSSLLVTGTTTLPNLVLTGLDIAGNGSVSGTFEAGTLKGDLILAHIGNSTLKTVQDMQNVYHSTGWVSGGEITPGLSGDISVSEGVGLIRDSLTIPGTLATLYFFDWPAVSNITLTDNSENFVYVDYNGGNPAVTVQTSEDTVNYQTRFLLAIVTRVGTELHVNQTVRPTVGDHAGLMIREMQQTMPYTNATGGEITAGTNPLAFDIADGAWWQGLNRFTTTAFDGDSDTFTYYYRNGTGGWTAVPGSTQIDNTRYDNGSGTLGTLGANRYGVHWIYMETDSANVSVVYGQGSYTLNEAQNVGEPEDLPIQLKGTAFIVGRVIVANGASSLNRIESVAMMQNRFPSQAIDDHNSLLSLQGGATDEYYHLTATQHDRLASGSASLAIMPNCSNGIASKLLYNPTTGVFTCGVDQNSGGGGSSSIQVREFRAGGFDSFPASVSFSASGFNLTASGSSDVLIALDYLNGPASRSIAQTITGQWTFTNASVSGVFEAPSLRATTIGADAGLTISPLTNLTLSPGSGGTFVTGNASVSGTLEATSLKATTITGDAGLFITLSQGGVLISGGSVSSNFEVAGFVSASMTFGSGLSLCNSASDKLQYSSVTGRFSCASEQNAKIEEGGVTVLASQHGLDFSASGFNILASGSSEALIGLDYINGPASRSIAQTITGAWLFTAASNQFSNTLEVRTASISALTVNGQTIASYWSRTGSNVFLTNTGDNVGIGTSVPSSRLTIAGTTSDYTANALNVLNLIGSTSYTVANSGQVAIGGPINANATLRVQVLTQTGTANVTTAGSSTTVTTTGNAFANIAADAAITANGQTRYVVTKIDNNTVEVDTAVDWSAGYSFTYRNHSNVAVDGTNADVRSFSIDQDGQLKWQLYSWHDIDSQFLSFWNEPAKHDILTISERGQIGINYFNPFTGVIAVPPADLAIYPTAFEKVFYFRNSSSTYIDFTDAVQNSEDTPTPITPAANVDFGYFGMNRKFSHAFVNILSGLTSGTIKLEYWNGGAWSTVGPSMGFTDGTNGVTQSGVVSWDETLLSGWAPNTVNGQTFYWVRVSWTSVVGGPVRFSVITPDAGRRLAIFQAQSDEFPAFVVNGFGRVALGNQQRPTRSDQLSGDGSVSPLNVIDSAAALRLWNFNVGGEPTIEFISGTASLTNNLEWSMHMASATSTTGAEGFWIERHIPGGGGETPVFTLGRTDENGVSRTSAVISNTFGNMTGGNTMRGLLLQFTNGSNSGAGNEVRGLDIGGITPGTASESAIVVGPGWDYAFIASQGNVGIGTETPNYRLEVAGAASLSQLYGAGLTACTNTSNKLQYDSSTGLFSCVNEQNARIENGGVTIAATQNGLDFSASGFIVTASTTGSFTETQIGINYANGPASRSIAQTITGLWTFAGGASVSNRFEVSGTASVSALIVGGTSFVPSNYLLLTGGTLSGQLSGVGASLSANLEVSGYASASRIFGAGLTSCTGSNAKLLWSGGVFSCGVDAGSSGQTIDVGDGVTENPSSSISFAFGQFVVSFTSPQSIIHLNWGVGGPASLSQDETVTGFWRFANSASITGNLEIGGYSSASRLFGAGLSTCSGAGQKLLWSSGQFSCGIDQTGGGGASIGLREGFTGTFTDKSSISFESNAFNLDLSQADARLSLDYVNGPASRSIPQTISALWTFAAGASVSGTLEATTLKALTLGSDAGLTIAPTSGLTLITGRASISSNLEVSGYASVSSLFGAGLTSCTGLFDVIRWDSATGRFSCHVEGGGLRSESSETTIIANNNAFNFDGGKFVLTASGTTETLINLNWGAGGPASRSASNTWTALNVFSAGASVTTNPFEVGTNVLYVNPSTGRVGINTQNLSESLEVVGNASISGNVYAANAGIGTTTITPGYRLDVNGAGRFGDGTHTSQTLLSFNVAHEMSLLYGRNQFGQSTFDGLQVRNGAAENNLFTVYGSQSAQVIANAQGTGFDSSLIAMNNASMANLTNATQGMLTNKATTHDIAIQYSFGGGAPIDAMLVDTNPTANSINGVIFNNANQNVSFQVKGQTDSNLLFAVASTSRIGIGTNAPLTKLEVQGTASASNLLTTGGLQVAGGTSVSYSRFGTNLTDRGLSVTSDLLISGKFEVDSQAFFDAAASISANLEVGGTASISGALFANGGLTVVGQLTAGNASLSGGLELTSAAALLGINAGGRTDTTLEVGGTASISGNVRFGSNASISANLEVGGTASISGKLNVFNSASISQNIEAVGYASASQIFGAGLTDCDSLDQRLAWTASGSNAGKFSCKSGAVTATYTTGIANVAANSLTATFLFTSTNTTAFAVSTAGNNEMKMNTAGYISSCAVTSDANVTAGVMKIVGRKNGATFGVNEYCTMNTTNPRTISEAIPAGALPFVAGDTVGVAASTSAAWAPTTSDFIITFTVTFPTGADLAETYYTHNDAVGPATVVSMDSGLFAGVTLASSAYDENALGVISTAPGLVLGDSDGPGRKVYVALSGRVPVWVSDENGPIKPGDWLTTSSTPGVAMKATRAGRVIGQALTEHSSAGVSQVVMFVKNTQYDGSQALQQMSAGSSDAQAVLSMLTQAVASSSQSSGILTDRLVAGLDIIAPMITTHELSVEMLRSGSDSISFQELYQQREKLTSLVAQMSAQASRSDELQRFIVETNTALTASDVMLAQSVASQSARVDALALRLEQAEFNLAALASDSHALTYNNVVLFSGGLKVDSIGSIGDLLTFGSDTYFFGRPYFNDDTAGFAVIRAGAREVRVPFTAPYLEAPIVNASLMTTASQSVDDLLTENVRFAIASVSGDGFTVRLSADAAADIRLSWIALAVHNARTVFSQIPVEVAPTAIPTVTPILDTPVVTVTATPDITPSPVSSASETTALTPEATPTPEVAPPPTVTQDVIPTMTPELTAAPVIPEPPPPEPPTATESASAQ